MRSADAEEREESRQEVTTVNRDIIMSVDNYTVKTRTRPAQQVERVILECF